MKRKRNTFLPPLPLISFAILVYLAIFNILVLPHYTSSSNSKVFGDQTRHQKETWHLLFSLNDLVLFLMCINKLWCI